jgi:L-ascorbate metabolism protein UlaG (beta-lactamase superfamily)
MKAKFSMIFPVLILFAALAPAAFAGTTTLIWHGHSAFEIRTPAGKVLMIDPWLRNPMNPDGKDGKNPVDAIKKADYILLTHGHFDHVADAAELAQKTGARLVATFDLGTNMAKLRDYPKDQMGFDTLMNIGGEITIADGEVRVTMTPAVHTSGLANPNAGDKEPDIVFGGDPVGFVIAIKGGPTIYDTGDTAFFSDMATIGKFYRPDVALINTGGHFGMEPPMAAKAAQAVGAPLVIPHHYATFPVLAKDPSAFIAALKGTKIRVRVMEPGSSIVFDGKKARDGK